MLQAELDGAYPLFGKPKPYQLREDRDTSGWVSAMLHLFEGWRELLTPTGSIMLNLGPVWNPGEPSQSLYVERLLIALEDSLGVKLLQRAIDVGNACNAARTLR